ncbi:UvrD-helicase domain-containing protein [Micromonospora gifhornensis]|uniref:UvrD-helicase domain-containing protein n=1 Tax=Micromonospora gifhornensis TaxID=84594 RepID=UPI00365220A4
MWDALRALGLTSGRVLEPGCGSGNMIGLAPEGMQMVGVELDPTTAAIAQALYPDARILAESFADTRISEGAFDAAIGNVPFGSHKPHDPQYNPDRRHSIHNHFLLKSLHLVRPGGIVALITSRYTMDGTDDAHQQARAQMADLADLVGAVRLPATAHAVAAGTEVVTDLLILRRRSPEATPTPATWLTARATEWPGAREGIAPASIPVNEYFLAHPDLVLGETLVDSSRHGPALTVRGIGSTGPALVEALRHITTDARSRGLVATPAAPAVEDQPDVVFHSDLQQQEGLFQDLGDGRFTQIRNGRPARHDPPKTQIAELRSLIRLRETVVALLDEEAAHREDTPTMARLRADLNRYYDTYVSLYGHINRYKSSISTRRDVKTGQQVESEQRRYPPMGGFRSDPFWPYVAALEDFDDETQESSKADIFRGRVVVPPTPATRAESPDDALVICWDTYNEIRLDHIAQLLDLDNEEQARQALGDLVYDEPGTGRLIRKTEYLSGNVRRKLADAQAAAETDERFATNVEALRRVVPRDLTAGEIEARLGSPWIDASYVQQFLREILEDDRITVSNIGARWAVSGGSKDTVLAHTVWGTKARCAQDLAANLLNSQTIEVTKTKDLGGGKKTTVKDTEATAFAQAKAQQLDARFRAWLWEEPQRGTALGKTYNDRFNALVPQSFDGETVTAPGMSAAYRLRPHQMAAVARIRNTPGVGLFHGTGAGKTLEMIVGGMELVRLGLVSKPAYVVPKDVLGQFQREFLRAYPRARILAADSEDLRGDKRRQFVARCSTGTWDAIILSHNAFKKIPVSKGVQVDYLNAQLDRLKAHLANAEDADRFTVKDIEKQVENLKEEIKELLAKPSDAGVEFERTGIGYLFIDEAHTYKNLRVISSITELAHKGNQITADLDMKLGYLRRTYGRRVVTLATATPIDNSPAEIMTMIKYAAPELLADAGIEEDDQFHATFIQPRRRVEMTADGSRFESKTRYARFVNIPELQRLLFSFADIKTKKDLKLGEPTIIGGQQEILSVPASAELREHMAGLAMRARAVTGGKPPLRRTVNGEMKEDNILWISNDGRAGSLDLRLVGRSTRETQKVDVTADRIAEIWAEHKDDVYFDENGEPEPRRGSLILVFCDLGVPKDGWNVYEDLRDKLVGRGIPAGEIRFAQEAKDQRKKAQLQQDARDGKISVLVGSRAKLGTGVNIQRRVIAIFQMDPTWKLTPITQSLGRGQRQGNANPAIHHIFLVTENSYDPFFWQKVDTKAKFTDQILDANNTARTIDAVEDDNGGRIEPAVMFAVGAGRPELLELARVEETFSALELERRIWHNEQFTFKTTIAQSHRTIADLEQRIQQAEQVIARSPDLRGDAFSITLADRTYDRRVDAGAALIGGLQAAVRNLPRGGKKHLQLGALGPFPLSALVDYPVIGPTSVTITLHDVPEGMLWLDAKELPDQDPTGLIRKIENRLTNVEAIRQRDAEHIERLRANIEQAESRVGQPFPRQDELDQNAARLRELQAELKILDGPIAAPESSPEPVDVDLPTTAVTSAPTTRGSTGGSTRASDVTTPATPAPDTDSRSIGRDSPDEATSQPEGNTTDEPNPQQPEAAQLTFRADHPAIDALLVRALDDNLLRQTARVNELDNFAHVVGPWLSDQMMAAFDDDPDSELARAYLADTRVARQIQQLVTEQLWNRVRHHGNALPRSAETSTETPTDHSPDDHTGEAVRSDPSSVPDAAHATPAPPNSPAVDNGEQSAPDRGQPDADRANRSAQSEADADRDDAALTPVQHRPDAVSGSAHDDAAPVAGEGPDALGKSRHERQGQSEHALPETQRARRGHPFYPPADLAVPALYATEQQPNGDKIIYLHYFGGGHDWWIAEYDPATGEGFGYACINGDADNAEWGYHSLVELEQIRRGLLIIERDLHWTPRPAREVRLPGWRADTGPIATPTEASTPTEPVEPVRGPAPEASASPTLDRPAPDNASTATPASVTPAAPAPPDGDEQAIVGPARQPQTASPAVKDEGSSAAATSAGETPSAGQEPPPSLSTVPPAAAGAAATPAPGGTPALAPDIAAAFVGGTPYTSRNRIRGPLRGTKTAANQLMRLPRWKTIIQSSGGQYQAEKDLAHTIDEFKTLTVDDSDPRDILDLSVRLARQSRDLRAARDHPGVDPVLAMLDNLARISSMLATDLVATALTPKRWQRVFPDAPARPLPQADPIPATEPAGTEQVTPHRTVAPSAPALDPAAAASEAAPEQLTTPPPALDSRPTPAATTPPTDVGAAGADERATIPDIAVAEGGETWSTRIQITVDSTGVTVTGTRGGPREDGLRSLLKGHRFRYIDGRWRYFGRRADRDHAVSEIRAWLQQQDQADKRVSRRAPQFPPTEQQQRIIDAYQQGKTIVVQALAGTGKTSTLQMLANLDDRRIAYIAFNRSIADEAKRKFPRNVTADTSHAFARAGLQNSPLRDKVSRVGPHGEGAQWPEEWAEVLGVSAPLGPQALAPEAVARLVMATVRKFRESDDDKIASRHLPDSLHQPDGQTVAAAVLALAERAWADLNDPDGRLRMRHDDYLKIWALGRPRLPYDVIFFDEAQDIAPVLGKVIKDQPVQTVVVGDSNQSIYAFRGAVDALRGWPADITLPLTQSFRFGPAVADIGNQFLALLDSPWRLAGNPALTSTIGAVTEPDAILAWTNAGAVASVFESFDAGRRVALIGGGGAIEDIAKAAKALQAGRRTTHPELANFANWDEVREYVESDDEAQSLRAFVRLVDRRGADELIYMAKELIPEERTDEHGNPAYDVIISTAHKSKGREWRNVRIADDFPQPQENTETGEVVLPAAEMLRLAYVTATRAKQRLDLGSLGWIQDFASQPAVRTPSQRQPDTERAPAPRPASKVGQQLDLFATVEPAQLAVGPNEEPQAAPVASLPRPTPAHESAADAAEALDDQPARAETAAQATAAAEPAEADIESHTADDNVATPPAAQADAPVPTARSTAVAVMTRYTPAGSTFTAERGKRWIKVVNQHQSAYAFVDPATDEWYYAKDWRSPNKRHPLNAEERAWLAAQLPDDLPQPQSTIGSSTQPTDPVQTNAVASPEPPVGDAFAQDRDDLPQADSGAGPSQSTGLDEESVVASPDPSDAVPANIAGDVPGTEPAPATTDTLDPAPARAEDEPEPPTWPTPARRAQLIKAIEDYAPRYTAQNTNGYVNSPARYVATTHVPGGASDEEWTWISDYIAEHPEVLSRRPLSYDELRERDRATSQDLSVRAAQALEAGDYDAALAIVDQAEPLYLHIEPWDEYRQLIRDEAASRQAAPPAVPDASPEQSVAAEPAPATAVASHTSQPEEPDIAEPAAGFDRAEDDATGAPGDSDTEATRATPMPTSRTAEPASQADARINPRRNPTTDGPGDVAAPDPFAPFTAVEAVRIAHAVQDWAANWYGQVGAFTFSREDAVRNVAEGHLQRLQGHSLAEVIAAVDAYLDAHPEILQTGRLTDEQRAQRQRERTERAQQLSRASYRAFQAGDLDQAEALIDQAQLASPDYQPPRTTWTEVRARIAAARDTRTASPANVAPPQPAAPATAATRRQQAPADARSTRRQEPPPVRTSAPSRTERIRPPATPATPPRPSAPSRAQQSAGRDDLRQWEDRAAMYERWAQLAATTGQPGMYLHRPGQPPQPLTTAQAIDAFNTMIDWVRRTGGVGARLAYNGVYISLGATGDPNPQLRIAVGHRTGFTDLPLANPWPAPATRGNLLRKIVNYIDAAEDRAVKLRRRIAEALRGAANLRRHGTSHNGNPPPAGLPTTRIAFPARPSHSARTAAPERDQPPTGPRPPVRPTATGEPEPGGTLKSLRQQVSAWVAQSVIYEHIATAAAAHPGGFARPGHPTLTQAETAACLAAAAAQARQERTASTYLTWGRVQVGLRPVDDRVEAHLSLDGINGVPVPIPDEPSRAVSAITDAITNARSRSAELARRADDLAARIADQTAPASRSPRPFPSFPAIRRSRPGHGTDNSRLGANLAGARASAADSRKGPSATEGPPPRAPSVGSSTRTRR